MKSKPAGAGMLALRTNPPPVTLTSLCMLVQDPAAQQQIQRYINAPEKASQAKLSP